MKKEIEIIENANIRFYIIEEMDETLKDKKYISYEELSKINAIFNATSRKNEEKRKENIKSC